MLRRFDETGSSGMMPFLTSQHELELNPALKNNFSTIQKLEKLSSITWKKENLERKEMKEKQNKKNRKEVKARVIRVLGIE